MISSSTTRCWRRWRPSASRSARSPLPPAIFRRPAPSTSSGGPSCTGWRWRGRSLGFAAHGARLPPRLRRGRRLALAHRGPSGGARRVGSHSGGRPLLHRSHVERVDDHMLRVLKHGDTFAIFDRYGDIYPLGLGEHGLSHDGTRHLSRLELRLGVDDAPPFLLSSTVRKTTPSWR